MQNKSIINRKNKLKEYLQTKDIILIINPVNTFYFTGFSASFSVIIITSKKDYYYTDTRYYNNAQKKIKNFDVRKITNKKFEFLNEYKNYKNIYIEFDYININLLNEISKYLSLKNFDISCKINEIRAIKDKTEISNIKIASNITNDLYNEIINNNIFNQYSENELVQYIKLNAYKNKFTDIAFEPIVAYDINCVNPHYEASNDKKPINQIMIDMGFSYKKYKSDLTRTLLLNKIKKNKLKYYYSIVEEAFIKAKAKLKPGIIACDIDKEVRNIFNKYGVEEYYLHSTGHGLGLEAHEYPGISRLSKYVLKQNNVITIEPGLYIPKLGGIRIEDTVLITKKGYRDLT